MNSKNPIATDFVNKLIQKKLKVGGLKSVFHRDFIRKLSTVT